MAVRIPGLSVRFFYRSADTGRETHGGNEGCAAFISCAVQLHYASCNPNMYCILMPGRERSASPPGVLTQRTVSGLCADSTSRKERRKRTMLPCNSSVSFFPAERTVRNASGPCLLLVLDKLKKKKKSEILDFIFFACLLVVNQTLSLNLPDPDIQVKKSNRSSIFETFQVSSSSLSSVIVGLCVGARQVLPLHGLSRETSISVLALLK